MIKINKNYFNKSNGVAVMPIWISNELVTYMTEGSGTPTPMRKFKFMQDFIDLSDMERDSALLNERMNDGQKPVAISVGEL